MDLSIVIVNYKTTEKTLACLESIHKTAPVDLAWEVIVVDNDSKEDLPEKIYQVYPSVKVVVSNTNLGMGEGNNFGIKNSIGEHILVLNADTLLKEKALEELYKNLINDEKIGIVAPRLLNTDGSLQYSCFRDHKFYTPILRRTFLGRFAKDHIANFLMLDFNHNEPREVDWAMGSCLLVRKDLINEDGIFDKRFFMYFEDTDLCRRAREAGYKVVYLPSAEVIHDHGRGSARSHWTVALFNNHLSREHLKSWIKYFWKWR